MKIRELIEEIDRVAEVGANTVDTVKCGDTERELKRLAVTMFPSVEVIRKAAEWGADMLLCHEPVYFCDYDAPLDTDTEVELRKRELVKSTGIVIKRFHDHMHMAEKDLICEGGLHYLGLFGRVEKSPYYASSILTLDEPVTAREIADRFEKRLGVRHVRIAGEREKKSTKIAVCFGMSGGVYNLLRNPEIEIVLSGEAESQDWQMSEYARDAAALGINKSFVAIGHSDSEKGGMMLLAERIAKNHPEIEVRHIDCGAPYGYTED